jgi:molybdate transport system substrate-binding protein
MKKHSLIASAILCVFAGAACAAEVHVAVAANFTAPAKDLAPIFLKQTGHSLILSFGATGMFYGQIKNGAEYDVLLAADAKTPAKAVREGYGVEGSNFTYAMGKLVLWSSDGSKVTDGKALLQSGKFERCAVANPKLAPYGLAAYQTLESLRLLEAVKPKFVEGNNIGATFNFVKTGNADIGFVALSQVFKNGRMKGGSGWIVPASLYEPIRQNAVLLKNGRNAEAAKAFLAFLRGPEAARVKQAYGYGN